MQKRGFLVALDEIPTSRDTVARGLNPWQTVVACRCVNIGLFLSRGLRRSVMVILTQGASDETRATVFDGKTLRRVSPDERSISFFLMKANRLLMSIEDESKAMMDNGIVVCRTRLESILDEWASSGVYLATEEAPCGTVPSSGTGLFVYDVLHLHRAVLSRTDTTPIWRPSSAERFILEVNHAADVVRPEESFIIRDKG
ncbi:MAG: hypothetical protein HXY34_09820 [Candidatus Thorarchaeota archaeon]|nr:hypothetical protein [Candidatus Thorarchaeota archaeon]